GTISSTPRPPPSRSAVGGPVRVDAAMREPRRPGFRNRSAVLVDDAGPGLLPDGLDLGCRGGDTGGPEREVLLGAALVQVADLRVLRSHDHRTGEAARRGPRAAGFAHAGGEGAGELARAAAARGVRGAAGVHFRAGALGGAAVVPP